jgi:hypothetical protein
MNINNINPYQGVQNAFRPDGGKDSAADNRPVSSAGGNLTDVYDPPFFPIATYQRQDSIKKARSVQTEVERSVSDQGPQTAPPVNKSESSAPDAGQTATPEIQPGVILSIKI